MPAVYPTQCDQCQKQIETRHGIGSHAKDDKTLCRACVRKEKKAKMRTMNDQNNGPATDSTVDMPLVSHPTPFSISKPINRFTVGQVNAASDPFIENSNCSHTNKLSVIPEQFAASQRFRKRVSNDVRMFTEYRDFETGNVIPCEIVKKKDLRPAQLSDLPPFGAKKQSDSDALEWTDEFYLQASGTTRSRNATIVAELNVSFVVGRQRGKVQRCQVQHVLENSFDQECIHPRFVVVVSPEGFDQNSLSFCRKEVFQKCQDEAISLLLLDLSCFKWHHPVADCRAYSILQLFQRHTAEEQIEYVLSWLKTQVPLSHSIGSVEVANQFQFYEPNVQKALRIAANQYELAAYQTGEYGFVVTSDSYRQQADGFSRENRVDTQIDTRGGF